MGVLRRIGYFSAILMLISGIFLFFYFWPVGAGVIIMSIAVMWLMHKGGQVAAMQKSLRRMEQIEAENQELRQREAQITDFIRFQKLMPKHWDDPS